jgi:hypothetical protein
MTDKRAYIVSAPNFRHNSAGIRAMHILCDILNRKGYEAYVNCEVVCKKLKTPTLFHKQEKLRKLILDGAIVVYPEWQKNILYSKAPINWQLAPWQTDMEKIFVFHDGFDKTKPQLYIDVSELDIFNEKWIWSKRSGAAIYMGKGTGAEKYCNFDLVDKEKKVTEITYKYPSSRRSLAKLLKSIKILYVADPLTNISSEARLCGCPVVYIGPKALEVHKATYIPAGYAFDSTTEEIQRAKDTLKDFFKIYLKDIGGKQERTVNNFINESQEFWINGTKEYA